MIMNVTIKGETEKKECLFPRLTATCKPAISLSIEGQKVMEEFKMTSKEIRWSSKRRKRNFSCPPLQVKNDCNRNLSLTDDTGKTCTQDFKMIAKEQSTKTGLPLHMNKCKDLSQKNSKWNSLNVKNKNCEQSHCLSTTTSHKNTEEAGGTTERSANISALENFPTTYCIDTNLDYNETHRRNMDEFSRLRVKDKCNSPNQKPAVMTFTTEHRKYVNNQEFTVTSKYFDSRLEWLERQPEKLELPSKKMMKKSVRKCQSWIRKYWDFL